MRNKKNLIYIAHRKQSKIMKPKYDKDFQPLTKLEKRIMYFCIFALCILLPYLLWSGRH